MDFLAVLEDFSVVYSPHKQLPSPPWSNSFHPTQNLLAYEAPIRCQVLFSIDKHSPKLLVTAV
jgi:hypothetical protein